MRLLPCQRLQLATSPSGRLPESESLCVKLLERLLMTPRVRVLAMTSVSPRGPVMTRHRSPDRHPEGLQPSEHHQQALPQQETRHYRRHQVSKPDTQQPPRGHLAQTFLVRPFRLVAPGVTCRRLGVDIQLAVDEAAGRLFLPGTFQEPLCLRQFPRLAPAVFQRVLGQQQRLLLRHLRRHQWELSLSILPRGRPHTTRLRDQPLRKICWPQCHRFSLLERLIRRWCR